MTFFKRTVLINVGMGSDEPFLSLAPINTTFNEIKGKIEKGDLLIFEGGVDISPSIYGEPKHPQTQHSNESRDLKEGAAYETARAKKIAMLGICRGAQLFTALEGGKLDQHVSGHLSAHSIDTYDGKHFEVSSCHHQMMIVPPSGQLLAWSNNLAKKGNNKEPEIVFYPEANALAIQSHPEWMPIDCSFNVYCRHLITTLLKA
jgi:gamma-glutamyl-gamma-aminobutyrate hydrolase PuuD